MSNKLSFIVGLGCVGNTIVSSYQPAIINVAGEAHELPMYMFGGTREECIKRITDDINRFFDEVEKEFPNPYNSTGTEN